MCLRENECYFMLAKTMWLFLMYIVVLGEAQIISCYQLGLRFVT